MSIIPDRKTKVWYFEILHDKNLDIFPIISYFTHKLFIIDLAPILKTNVNFLFCVFNFSAAVARMNKFYNVPLLTAGGFTYNFNEPKQSFDDEFHLLVKTGQSFEDMVEFMFEFYKR